MHNNRGFTLVELVVVIVLLGIIGVSTFAYLGFGGQIFRDTVERSALASEGRFVVERLTREIRNALPASVRVNGNCIEYVPVLSSSLYLSLPTSGATSVPFDVAESAEGIPLSEYQGRRVFVYANTEAHIYEGDSSDARWHAIEGVARDGSVLTFDIQTGVFGQESPARRYYVASTPVSWCQSGAALERFEGYGWFALQLSATGLAAECAALASCSSAVMARQVSPVAGRPLFQVEPATLRRNALIELDFQVQRLRTSETARFNHEIHVPNVP